jgi:hypothetical protein
MMAEMDFLAGTVETVYLAEMGETESRSSTKRRLFPSSVAPTKIHLLQETK